MTTEEVWQWRIRWGKRTVPTRFKATAEFMSTAYPEAVRVPDTMELRNVCTSADEWQCTGPVAPRKD